MDRKLQPNFTSEESEMLLNRVEKRSRVLFSKFDSMISSAAKEKAWEEVDEMFVDNLPGLTTLIPDVISLEKNKCTCYLADCLANNFGFCYSPDIASVYLQHARPCPNSLITTNIQCVVYLPHPNSCFALGSCLDRWLDEQSVVPASWGYRPLVQYGMVMFNTPLDTV